MTDQIVHKYALTRLKGRALNSVSKTIPGIGPSAPGILSYRVPDVDRRVRSHAHNVPAIRDKGNGL